MDPIAMKLVGDDLILQALREDIAVRRCEHGIGVPPGTPGRGAAHR